MKVSWMLDSKLTRDHLLIVNRKLKIKVMETRLRLLAIC